MFFYKFIFLQVFIFLIFILCNYNFFLIFDFVKFRLQSPLRFEYRFLRGLFHKNIGFYRFI